MAITVPNTNPSVYSDPAITRYGLISGLNIVTVAPYDKFIETRGFVPYVLVNELAGNVEKSDHKQFTWYQNRGAFMGFVTSSAAVTVAAGATATITVGAGGYSQSGTKSLPAVGLILYNSRTGIEGRVTSTNTSTANAHTFTLAPVNAGENVSTNASDELLSRGFKLLGEQSDKTATIIRNIDKYSNYCTQLRADTTIGDLSMAERIDFQINGNYSYTYKQKQDDDLRLLLEREYLIMEGTQTNNLPYVEEGSNGVIKQVQANGINATYNTFDALTTFSLMERALSSIGAPKEYDVLSDNSSYIEIQNSFGTVFNNGAIMYSDSANSRGGIDINRDFKSYKVYGRKYNFTNYQLFDEQSMYGSSGTGLRNRFSLFVPVGGTGVSSERGTTVTVPRFTVMYQTPNGGNKWHMGETGLFADTPTSTKAERVMTTIGYWGVRVAGAQQYAIMKGI